MKSRTRATVVCVHDAKVLVFKGVDPTSGREYLFLPGGKIESGEDPSHCCRREALEETGYKLRILDETEIISIYTHEWDGEVYDCRTFFYAGVLNEPWHEPGEVHDADYNKGVVWWPLARAEEAFGYTPEILAAVLKLSER